MSSPVRASGDEPEYPQHDYGIDDLAIDVEATPATARSYSSFRASTGALVAPTTLFDQIVPFPHLYKPDFLRAFQGGLAATLVFTLFWYPLYFGFKNPSMDICLLLGSYIVPGDLTWLTRFVGIGMHLGIGIGIAFAYATALQVLRTQSHAGKGTLFGIGIFFFMAIWVLPWVAPMAVYGAAQAQFDAVSPFLDWLGSNDQGWSGFALGLIAHLMYGSILGAVYRHKRVDPSVGV
ncbi:MAG: hypothetical protein H7Z41_06875 [Cytophagales bacterium]|nr:hypothetical protein [Armatimonadota bacterium]